MVDQVFDFLGGRGRTLGQAAHFAGHHRKTTAVFAGARRFDGGIQGQDIGLEGDAVDQADNVENLARRAADFIHGADHFRDDGAAFRGHGGGLHRQVIGGGHVIGAALHGRGQLFHAGGRLLQAGRLRFGAAGQVHIAGRNLGRGHADILEIGAHVADNAVQIDIGLAQGRHQLAHVVVAHLVDGAGQVAASHLARHRYLLAQGLHHRVMQIRPEHQHDHRRHGGQRDQPAARGRMGVAVDIPDGASQHDHGDAEEDGVDGHALRQAGLAQGFQPGAQALANDPAIAEGQLGLVAILEALVQRRRFGHLLARGLGAHRHVAHRTAVFDHRGDIGQYPVIIAVLAAVLDHAGPRHAALDGAPQVGKRFGRHIGVAQDILRRTQQF